MSNPSAHPLNDLQQRVILPNVLCNSSVHLHAGRMHGVMRLQQSSVAIVSNAMMYFCRFLLSVHDLQVFKQIEMPTDCIGIVYSLTIHLL